jgi:hypothetical protein
VPVDSLISSLRQAHVNELRTLRQAEEGIKRKGAKDAKVILG